MGKTYKQNNLVAKTVVYVFGHNIVREITHVWLLMTYWKPIWNRKLENFRSTELGNISPSEYLLNISLQSLLIKICFYELMLDTKNGWLLTLNTRYWTKTPSASTPLAACASATVCSVGTGGAGTGAGSGAASGAVGVRVAWGVCTRLPRGPTVPVTRTGSVAKYNQNKTTQNRHMHMN